MSDHELDDPLRSTDNEVKSISTNAPGEEQILIEQASGGEENDEAKETNDFISPMDENDESDHFNPNERISPRTLIDGDSYRFVRDFYRYYEEKGFTCILLKEISNILIPLAINLFTFVILNHINLVGMLRCKGEECAQIPIVINLGLFYDYSWTNYLVIFFCLGVFGYICFLIYRAWNYLNRMLKIKKLLNIDLGIDEDTLKTISWGEVVDTLILKNKEIEIFRSEDVDSLDIVNYVMRFDNFIISFEHLSLLDLKLPLLSEPILPEVVVYNLRWVLRDLFKNQNLQRPIDMATAAEYLKKRFILYGILNTVLSPFIFLYIIIKVFFKYFAEFHHNKTFFFNRTWSTLSLWRFRSYNELPHEFKKRISKSHFYADLYVNQFPSPLVSILGKNLMFFSSAFCVIILALTTFKNTLLIHMTFMGENLLWWSVILLAVFAGASGLVIGKYDVFRPQKYMNKVGKYTHFLPEKWKVDAREPEVVSDFTGKYFQMKIKWFLIEILSIFITPYFLIFKFPESSRVIVEFIRAVQEKQNREKRVTNFMMGGPVCGFATFQFDDFGHFRLIVDERVGNQARRHEISMKQDGKLAKSYLLFKANHPNWKERSELGRTASILCNSLIDIRKKKNERKIKEVVLRQSRIFGEKGGNTGLIQEFHSEKGKEDYEDDDDDDEETNKKLKKKLKKRLRDNQTNSEIAIGMLHTLIKEKGTDLKQSMDEFSQSMPTMVTFERREGKRVKDLEMEDRNIAGEEEEKDGEGMETEAGRVLNNLDPQVEKEEEGGKDEDNMWEGI